MPPTVTSRIPAHTVPRGRKVAKKRGLSLFGRFLSALGPGLIAGAADDDPSGIATYSAAGALLGTTQLWTAFLTWPLMAAVQMTCARIAMATGKGLAGALRQKLPRPLLVTAVLAFVVANTFNIAADLAGMADAAEMLTGINSHFFVVLFGIALTTGPIFFGYEKVVPLLKWLALSLCAYIITALVARPDWGRILHATFIPSLPGKRQEWAMLVAVLGTTITPYLFFWQASQEVEEGNSSKRRNRALVRASHLRIVTRRLDVGVGTFFSNIGMYFIILTTALTLHPRGITNISTSDQAAEALRPLAGNFASLLFTLGIIGVGFLAIPMMSTSAAYAAAEAFGWRAGLSHLFSKARPFYCIFIFATAVGIVIDFADINAIKALYWSALINGLLAPFLLVGILLVAIDQKLMRKHTPPVITVALVAVTACLMLGAVAGMFVF